MRELLCVETLKCRHDGTWVRGCNRHCGRAERDKFRAPERTNALNVGVSGNLRRNAICVLVCSNQSKRSRVKPRCFVKFGATKGRYSVKMRPNGGTVKRSTPRRW